MKKWTSFCIVNLLCALPVLTTRADSGVHATATAVVHVAGQTGTVRGDRCNVRSRPSATAELVAQLNKGDTVEIRESKTTTEGGQAREWLRISLPATAKCFVTSKFIADGTVTADSVNVRCGPGANYRDIGKLTKGDRVESVGASGTWTQIKPTAGCSGWISADLVEVAAAATPALAPVAEVITPPVAHVPSPAPPAQPDIKVVSTDPDVHIQYIIKSGVIKPVADADDAPANYQLMTPMVERREHRICFLETDKINLERYVGKLVRVAGNERWHKSDRYPILAIDRVNIVW